MSWVSNKVITDLRQLMFERLMRLPASYFDANASSIPATRIAYDVNGVAAVLADAGQRVEIEAPDRIVVLTD